MDKVTQITEGEKVIRSFHDHMAGRSKKLERDALGRVVREFFPDESCVEYAYNALGQLASVVDQNANELKFDWSRFGLESKTTAAGQLTDYVYDEYGLLSRVDSREQQQVDRSIAYTYDQYDRVEKVTYGSGETESFQYDAWGRVICATRGERKATMRYDYFGRLVEKREGNLITTYAYNPWGQRISRTTEVDGLKLSEERSYDKFGRLTEIKSGEKSVVYVYNRVNQLERQIVDNVPIEFTYTKYGQLESKILGGRNALISKLEYRYGSDGMVLGRLVDGKYQSYQYDRKGQLLAVRDEKNLPVEEYVYDPAGNILKKTVAGKTTVYTYDAANQLKTSETDGVITEYAYDAAGRLVKEGDKVYRYGYLDKVLSVQENGQETASFDYYVNGQIASATYGDQSESFLWDGLALIKRGTESFINEPAVTGGNPVFGSESGVMFNDMLGTTLGIKGDDFARTNLTAFGENLDAGDKAFFTGKPLVGELGYAFLFRNYRPEQGKWQTADPLGYPDGWNNLAYVNNGVTMAIDWLGAEVRLCQRGLWGLGNTFNHTWLDSVPDNPQDFTDNPQLNPCDDPNRNRGTVSGMPDGQGGSSGSGSSGSSGSSAGDNLISAPNADINYPNNDDGNFIIIPTPGGMTDTKFMGRILRLCRQ